MRFGFRSDADAEFPPIVHVETTNVCNLRCIHCPHDDVTRAIPEYAPGRIGLELWKRVADEVALHRATLRMTPDGEPLLLADFPDQVEYARARGVHALSLNTNGMFLDGSRAEALLVPSGTNVSVEISLDGLFPDTYAKTRVGGDYRRVLANVLRFVEERNRRGLDRLKIMVSIVRQPEVPDEEIEAFHRFWRGIVDKVIFRNYVDTKGLTPAKYPGAAAPAEARWPCLVLFTRLVVTWDGRLRFCPDDWQKATTLLTLDEAGSLRNAWRSPAYEALRASHIEGTFAHPVCARCTDWKVIRWGKDYTAALGDLFGANGERPPSEFMPGFGAGGERPK